MPFPLISLSYFLFYYFYLSDMSTFFPIFIPPVLLLHLVFPPLFPISLPPVPLLLSFLPPPTHTHLYHVHSSHLCYPSPPPLVPLPSSVLILFSLFPPHFLPLSSPSPFFLFLPLFSPFPPLSSLFSLFPPPLLPHIPIFLFTDLSTCIPSDLNHIFPPGLPPDCNELYMFMLQCYIRH